MFSCRFLFKKFGSFVLVTLISIHALAQPSVDTLLKNNKIEDKPPQKQLSMEIYGFILADAIYDFKQMDPNWFDVPTNKIARTQGSICAGWKNDFQRATNEIWCERIYANTGG